MELTKTVIDALIVLGILPSCILISVVEDHFVIHLTLKETRVSKKENTGEKTIPSAYEFLVSFHHFFVQLFLNFRMFC